MSKKIPSISRSIRKSILVFTFIFMTAFLFIACASNSSQKNDSSSSVQNISEQTNILKESSPSSETANIDNGSQSSSSSESIKTDKENKILIAYFSHTGNTKTIANIIHDSTGGDLFQITTVEPYPEDYDECVDKALQEQKDNARPELSAHVKNMESYDVVFIGYPNWWGTMPMAVFTFLEEYDFAGKTIVPFCTHEGSGLGRSESDIAKLCPESTLLESLAIRGSSVQKAQDDVNNWLKELKMID